MLQDEVFTVLEGTMGYVIEGVEGQKTKGATCTMPVGKSHTFWNADPNAILTVKVIPLHQVQSEQQQNLR